MDINCAAIPEHLLEAELFGDERGAFTDARLAKPGLLQVAHRGTLFLDEIALLPEPLQAKLLKFLDDGAVRRLGATATEVVDVWGMDAGDRRAAWGALDALPENRWRGGGAPLATRIEGSYASRTNAASTMYTAAMPANSSAVRLLAVVMVVVILATVATPARAEADALAIAGIVSLAVAGVILVVYLIAAAGSDRGGDARFEPPEPMLLAVSAQAP